MWPWLCQCGVSAMCRRWSSFGRSAGVEGGRGCGLNADRRSQGWITQIPSKYSMLQVTCNIYGFHEEFFQPFSFTRDIWKEDGSCTRNEALKLMDDLEPAAWPRGVCPKEV